MGDTALDTPLDTPLDTDGTSAVNPRRGAATTCIACREYLDSGAVSTAHVDAARQADRERIARDLHDHVLQRLFAAGLTTQNVARGLGSRQAAVSLEAVVSELDEAIREIRAAVFELDGPLGRERGSVSTRLASVVSGLAPLLAFDPTLQLLGPVDELPEELVADLVAVLREGLVNVKRHADATTADVTITVQAHEVRVELTDDGRGIGGSRRWSGLANLRTRARQHGGDLVVCAVSPGRSGTSLQWTARLS